MLVLFTLVLLFNSTSAAMCYKDGAMHLSGDLKSCRLLTSGKNAICQLLETCKTL